ncbi:MAG: EAL and HDOD domain-containing protein [Clostridiaceae bacterium]
MDIFMARQPVFNKENQTIGYELLFRSGNNNFYDGTDGDKATLDVLKNSFYVIGIDNVTKGKKALINFTENILKEDILSVLPPDKVVVEILESVEPSEEMISICKRLKQYGYTIILDDFIFDNKYKDILRYVDIIKVDFKITKGIERKNIIQKVNSENIKFLAEKVETIEEFNEAVYYGYTFFQGYYFSKPVMIIGKDIPQVKYTRLKMMEALSNEEVDFEELERLILGDVSTSYKLLKLLNSSIFCFKNKIESVKQAISLIGEIETKKWLYIILMSDITQDKPQELLISALVRAKFCEIICKILNRPNKSYNAYLTGMFSLLDVILNKSFDTILGEINIPFDVKEALLGVKNDMKDILDLTIAYERCQWDYVIFLCEKLHIKESNLIDGYIEAIKWVRNDIK